MFENLSDKLERALKVLKGQGRITEVNVAETLKEVRKALIDADVSYKIAKQFTDDVKQKALGQNVLTAIRPEQLMVKIVHDEMTELMGSVASDINLKGGPAIVMMVGLNGSGKTTHSAKLANFIKHKKGRTVLLAACDTYRPAAIDQLKVLGEQVGVEVFSIPDEKDPVKVAEKAIAHAKNFGIQTVIVDTAGRLAIDEALMNEVRHLKDKIKPQETLFVVDAMTGQDAVNTSKSFYDRLQYEGVILTKLDGDTRGGAALTIRSVVNVPIKFVGVGEKMDALDVFHPSRMADRILGMGDIVSLVEKAQEQYDEEEAKKLAKKFHQNKFNFNDFYKQIQQIKKMGNMKDMLSMIPGMGKAVKDVDIDDNAFKGVEAIIQSMTPKERENPDLLNGQRKMRIAKGSGTSVVEVNRLVKQLDDMQKMMRNMSGNKMRALSGMMGRR